MRPRAATAILLLVTAGCSAKGTATPAPATTSIPSTTVVPTSTTVVPARTMPWISTQVELNSRDQFAHTLDARGIDNAPACTLDQLLVTATLGGAGGAEYAGIKVRNVAAAACAVQGSPLVQFLDGAQRNLGGDAPNRAPTDARIVLVEGSWAAVGLTPVGADHCGGPDNDAFTGTTVAAIVFGVDASATRVVPTGGDPPRTNGCPPSTSSGDHTGPFTAIPLSTTPAVILGPLRNGIVLTAPREVQRGTTASYSIVFTNTDVNTMVLVDDDCPLYRQSIGSSEWRPLLLNCGGADGVLIAPHASVQFDMKLPVPLDLPLGPTTLRWQLVEPEARALSATVTVVDQSHAPPP